MAQFINKLQHKQKAQLINRIYKNSIELKLYGQNYKYHNFSSNFYILKSLTNKIRLDIIKI